MKPDLITVTVERCRQKVPVAIAIVNAQFDAKKRPVSVLLGTPRVAAETWMDEVCIFEQNEIIDLTPEEDAAAIRMALGQLDDENEEHDHHRGNAERQEEEDRDAAD